VVLLLLWALGLALVFLFPLMFPSGETASFFSTTLLERRPPFDFVNLYIPANPFYSLANNVVPAVVLFSIVLGVAVIGLERKPVLLDLLHVVSGALSRATRFIVQLTPYGLFAIAATAAGTLSLEQLGRLQVSLVAYVGVSLLLSLWVLPGLVAALTPIRARDIFSLTRNGLITAFVAGDLFIVLPVLIEASRTLVARTGVDESQRQLPDVIVPASFNFPHTGKLLSISFVLFAGWFADAAVPLTQYPQLALTGLVTFFGSVNVAVPFLLDVFRIPADTFQLFVASGVINARFGTLVAAMHTLAVALLGSCAMAGTLRIERRRVVRYLVITGMLTAAFIGGTRLMFGRMVGQGYTKDRVLAGMHLLHQPVEAVVHRTPRAATAEEPGPRLDVIRRRGVLTVGYFGDALPYAFFNANGDLVGFDVDLAHRLASELGVRLEFVALSRDRLHEAIANTEVDLVMAGVVVTTPRASQMVFSDPYLDETLAFVVLDGRRHEVMSWDELRARPGLRIGIPDMPYYVQKVRERLPGADLRVVSDFSAFFLTDDQAGLDGMVFPAERGSAWTLMYPKFAVVVPEPDFVKVPLAYPIGGNDQAFARFVNTWIELKRKDGTIDGLYKYWILGQDAAPKQPRWSIMRNVLHWTK
jgi:ABC-type amino acid transport substrate-binding protein/Na+/H+-dicarboxylate symporter